MFNKLYFHILVISFSLITAYTAVGQLPLKNEFEANDLPCMILKNLSLDNIDSIRYNVREWVGGNEECVFGILDKLADYYIDNSSFAAFSCIAAICNNAENKISDYLIDINGSIFYASFGNYARYLNFYNKNYREEHCFVKYLISALSLQIAASANENRERKIITEHIKTESRKFKLTDEETNYIMNIYYRCDTAIWK